MSEQEQISAEMQNFLQQQSVQQQMQAMVSGMTEKCWDKCISSPGRYLGSREETCLSDCAQRFIEVTQFVIHRFNQKAGEGGF